MTDPIPTLGTVTTARIVAALPFKLSCPTATCHLHQRPMFCPTLSEASMFREAHNWAYEHDATVTEVRG